MHVEAFAHTKPVADLTDAALCSQPAHYQFPRHLLHLQQQQLGKAANCLLLT
jgi:hypothetical protein